MDKVTFIFGPGVEGCSTDDAAVRSRRSFVRSEGELAVYEASRNPTGHVLTAWEAFESFGLDVLEEAVEYGSAILRRTRNSTQAALKNRRTALGVTQKSVGGAARVPEAVVGKAESCPSSVPVAQLERIAFTLGLDERLLAFQLDSGGDSGLAYRLRTLVEDKTTSSPRISAGTALLFAEAASIIRAQTRLQKWLGLPTESHVFEPHGDYGSPMNQAWKIGYRLAEDARETLGLGQAPVWSMRELVEKRMGIPVIQARLPPEIAGATVTTKNEDGREARGVVLNTVGGNENVWIRRATLAHELGHLLYDPDSRLQNVRVDSYVDSRQDPETHESDFVEQRANAFAIAFLAPIAAVRKLAPTPVSEESVSDVMHTFGISHTAAWYHISNTHYRQYPVPSRAIDSAPSDEQTAAENFTVDFFPISDTPDQRRGRFSDLVTACHDRGLISEDTAALYLRCSVEDFRGNLDSLRALSDVEDS